MPWTQERPSGFGGFGQEREEAKPDPTFGETVGAGFALENDVANVWEWYHRKTFTPDPTFDVEKRAKELRPDLWETNLEDMAQIQSDPEMHDYIARSDQERKHKETLARAGWMGTGAALAAGVVSPTLFIPGLTAAKGLKGVRDAALLAGVGALAQEIPLQANQVERTAADTAFSIGSSMVLGGIIGVGASALRRGERAALENKLSTEGGVTITHSERAIPGSDTDVRVPGPGRAVRQAELGAPTKDGQAWTPSTVEDAINATSPKVEKAEAALEAAQRGYQDPTARLSEAEGRVANAEVSVIAAKLEKVLPDEFEIRVDGDTLRVEHHDIEVGSYKAGDDPADADWLDELVRTGKTADLEKRVGELADDVAEVKVDAEGRAQSAGAAAVEPTMNDPGGIAGGRAPGAVVKALNSNFITRDPVLTNIASDSPVARTGMAQLDDSGVSLDSSTRGIPAAPKGTVSRRVGVWYGQRDDLLRNLRDSYARYRYDMKADAKMPRFAESKAAIGGLRRGEKMSRKEFNQEITRAAWNNDAHANPYIQEMAQKIRKEFVDPVVKAAQAAGILGDDLPKFKDASWMMHKWDRDLIDSRPIEFIRRLANEYEKGLQEKFAKKLEAFNRRQAKDEELVSDLGKTKEEIDKLRADFIAEEKGLEADEMLTAWEDVIAGQNAHASQLEEAAKSADPLQRQRLLEDARVARADAKAMEDAQEESLAPRRSLRRAIKRRLRNFNRAESVLEERQAAKLEKAESNEDNQIRSLETVARQGQRVLNQLDRVSDEVLDKKLANLKALFIRSAQIMDRGELRFEKLAEGDPDWNKIFDVNEVQAARGERLERASDRYDDLAELDRGALRQNIQARLDKTIERVQRINAKRAVRRARLLEDAANLDPKQVHARVRNTAKSLRERKVEFLDAARRGGADVDNLLEAGDTQRLSGSVSFRAFAEESATKTKDRITGTFVRMPQMEVMEGARGSQLVRTLDVKGTDFADFMDTDIESIMHSFYSTMAPDIEIAGKFGDNTASSVIGRAEDEGVKGSLWREMDQRLAAIDTDEKLTPDQKAKQSLEMKDRYQGYAQNFAVVIDRLRSKSGIPKNPDGFAYRAAQVVQNLNVMRYMGMVTVSSLPDVARPIMRNGLVRTFRDGWLPFIRGTQEFKANKREALLASVGTDALHSTRYKMLYDLTEDMGRRNKFERVVEFATAKQGVVALFNYWTDAMKQIAASTTNARMFDNIAQLAQGNKLPDKEITFLADNGIGPKEANAIWKEVIDNGGGGRVRGVWLPQTELWKDQGAVFAYRAAIKREADNMIVTPGPGKPGWTDASLPGKMIGQFKGFALASTSKTLVAGLQQRDAAVVMGLMSSLGLGALSYYLSSVLSGGRNYDEMLKAGLPRFADEAVNRSGMLGAFGIAQDALSRVPITQRYVTFEGGRTTRRGGDNLLDVFAGPTADAIGSSANVLTGLHDPTQNTVHEIRKLLPWQNLIGVRTLFDEIEAATPVRRTQ